MELVSTVGGNVTSSIEGVSAKKLLKMQFVKCPADSK